MYGKYVLVSQPFVIYPFYKIVQLIITHTIAAGQKTLKASRTTDIHRSFRLLGTKLDDPLNSRRSKQSCKAVQVGRRTVILLGRPLYIKVYDQPLCALTSRAA